MNSHGNFLSKTIESKHQVWIMMMSQIFKIKLIVLFSSCLQVQVKICDAINGNLVKKIDRENYFESLEIIQEGSIQPTTSDSSESLSATPPSPSSFVSHLRHQIHQNTDLNDLMYK